jgi:hypothetical protein
MPRVAMLALGALALVLAIAAVPLAVLSRQLAPVEPLVVAGSFTVVGLVVARRQPRNPMGWLLAGVGTLVPLTVAGGYYAVLVYRLGYRLPFGPVALLLDVSWAAAFMLLPLAILLFPDGRLPSRRWQWILRVYVALSAGFVIAVSWAAVNSLGTREPIDASGGVTAVDHPAGWVATVQVVALLLLAPFWLAFVVRQVQSWRHADGERRQQLKWLVSGAAICMIAVTIPAAGTALDPLPSSQRRRSCTACWPRCRCASGWRS